MTLPVDPKDFELGEDGAFHVPTGAMFWTRPDSRIPYMVTWGKAEDLDHEGKPEYEKEDIRQAALILLKERAR